MPRKNYLVRTLALVFLATMAAVMIAVPIQIRPVQATDRGFNLLGFINGWNFSTTSNPIITVKQFDTVTINAKPGDNASHQWFLDLDNNGVADCSPGPDICGATFSTSNAPALTFQDTFAVSTFTYYCSIHPGTMHGHFTTQLLAVGGARYAE